MNRLEFDTVMDQFGIYHAIDCVKGYLNTLELVYDLRSYGIRIYFSGNLYAIIKGAVPIEVIKNIYKKYECYCNSIKIDINNVENGCLNEVCISKKEALIIFITEINNYYLERLSKKNKIKFSRSNQIKLIKDVNLLLLNKGNFTLSSDEWIANNNATVLTRTKYGSVKNDFDISLRKLLDQYDKTVNPFCNSDLNFCDSLFYSNKVNFNFSSSSDDLFSICLENDDVSAQHYKSNYKMVYYSSYKNEFGVDVQLNHNFRLENKKTNQKEEELIWIHYFYNNLNSDTNLIELIYNITTHEIISRFSDSKLIEKAKKEIIIDELNRAIASIETKIIDNIVSNKTKCEKRKKLIN